MLTIVTLNPCIDCRLDIPTFTRGGMNRVNGHRQDVAGKGINVSVALKNLETDNLCTGFNFIGNGALLTRFLDDCAIAHDFVYTEGTIRTNIKLCEADTGIMTELNQPGAYVPPEAIEALTVKISEMGSAETDLLILSGSRPQGVDASIYEKLAALWKGKVIVDTDGDALYKSVHSHIKKPFLIKPNLYELETAFNCKLSTQKDIVYFCRALALSFVCVSLGQDGALLITQSQAFYAPAATVPVRGLPGAGDAMVAGLAYGVSLDAPPKEMLKLAVTAAAASVMREGTQMCTREGFDKIYKKTEVREIVV